MLRSLTDAQRDILVLRCQGKNTNEVAQIRGCSDQALKNTTTTLMKKLRKALPEVTTTVTGANNLMTAACYRVGVLKGQSIERKRAEGSATDNRADPDVYGGSRANVRGLVQGGSEGG